MLPHSLFACPPLVSYSGSPRAGGQFEVLFRAYGPEKSFFEKKWQLSDIEEVK